MPKTLRLARLTLTVEVVSDLDRETGETLEELLEQYYVMVDTIQLLARDLEARNPGRVKVTIEA